MHTAAVQLTFSPLPSVSYLPLACRNRAFLDACTYTKKESVKKGRKRGRGAK